MMSEEGQKHTSAKTLEQGIMSARILREALQKQAALEEDQVQRTKIELERLYVGYQMPHGWMVHADVLKRAADAVIAEYRKLLNGTPLTGFYFIDLDSVYLYLMGAAVENVLKGIFVARHPKLIQLVKESIYEGKGRKKQYKGEGYKLNPKLGTHKLTSLAKSSGIDLTSDECNLLGLFEKFIEWAGRYKIPKDSLKYVDAQFSTYYEPDGESRALWQGSIETFSTSANNLYEKCREILSEEGELWKLSDPALR
jgi:hypothetical protein